ncbi:MAG: hypothetical protein ACR2Q4_01355 [Geminicoccaceae bacterium]
MAVLDSRAFFRTSLSGKPDDYAFSDGFAIRTKTLCRNLNEMITDCWGRCRSACFCLDSTSKPTNDRLIQSLIVAGNNINTIPTGWRCSLDLQS